MIKTTSRSYKTFKVLFWVTLYGVVLLGDGPRKKTQSPSFAPGWEVIGPGGGGIFLPTISPFDSNLVLTHCDMTGACLTYDGGKNWREFNL